MRLPKRFLTALFAFLLTATLIVIPVSMVSAAAIPVSLSSYSGPPSTTVYVSGTGFAFTPAQNYTVSFGTITVLGSTGVPTGGTISAWFGVPTLPRGVYDVKITTGADTTALPYPSFTITPQVFLNISTGKSGDQLIVNGNGFSASGTITIYFDGVAMTTPTVAYTDSFGQFYNATITIPQASGGLHTVSASDGSGISPSVSYTVTSSVSLSLSTGAVGSSVAITGGGFAANSVISFTIDSIGISATATADAYGRFTNVNLVIPEVPSGAHVITAQDSASHSATANFVVTPTISLNPTSGLVDTSVTLAGKGFLATSHITVTFDGANMTIVSTALMSDVKGSFTANFKIPATSSGNHVIAATDGTNSLNVSFNSSFVASSTPGTGPVGTAVTVTGSGFKLAAKVTVTYNGSQLTTFNTNSTGGFTNTFSIPAASTGSHVLTVSDGSNSKDFTFIITPTLNPITPVKGFIGTQINLSGSGLGASKVIVVSYDGNPVSLTSSSNNTDSTGTFSVSFNAPVSKSGAHTVTLSDGTTTQNFTFTIDATAPALPTPSLPLTGTKLGTPPVISWTPVTSSNGGITYELQISKDINFATVLVDKPGLSVPTYTLNTQVPAEKLKSANKNAPYYWRVRVTDAAANTSAWTTPQTFIVGLVFSDYLIYIVFGVIALLLGGLGFVLGRLTRKKSSF